MIDEQPLDDRIDVLIQVLKAYDAAAEKFIAKVKDGRARSVETLADLQRCRVMSVAARGLFEGDR